MPIEETEVPGQEQDTPPKVEMPKRSSKRPAPGTVKLKNQVAELYAMIGMTIVTPIDRLAGHLLAANSEEIAEQWVALAETNPAVKRALQKLVEAGGWGGVIMAHGMIVLPVLANRGLLPDPVAQGMAFMTATQHPETAVMFTHPRFVVAQPTVPTTENGNGSS